MAKGFFDVLEFREKSSVIMLCASLYFVLQ